MAGSSSNNSNQMISGINMTPLVDIMLVLLIIFLVTAKLSTTPSAAIPMNLPKSATGEGTQTVFSVELGRDGSIAVNGQKLAADDAIQALATAERTKHSDIRAVIQADGQVMHERIIHVIDLLSRAGISQIAFGVELSKSAP